MRPRKSWWVALACATTVGVGCGTNLSGIGTQGSGGAANAPGTGGSAGRTAGSGGLGDGGAAGLGGTAGRGTVSATGGAGVVTTGGTTGTGTGGVVGTGGVLSTGGGGQGTGGAGTGGSVGTGGTSVGTGGTGPVVGCGAAQTLADSTDTLLGLFVEDAGVIVVDTSTVSLIGRDAKIIKSVPFSRQITAAAFDGTRLVIADEAEITVMSPSLDVGPTAYLTMSCASAVLVGEDHFVCGPATDWERTFYTYDVGANPPAQIATSSGSYTYQGTAMTRVPGTDTFVTVENGYSLFQVAPDTGIVSLLAESPIGAETLTALYAFDGTPAAHLIESNGDILGLTGTGCQSSTTGAGYGCFVQSGQLGTLRTGQGFIGLGDDGAGQLVGVVNGSGSTYPFDPPCAGGCPVQDIDVATRTILQQQTYTIADLAAVTTTLYDPGCGGAIVAYSKVPPGSTFTGSGSGYRVQAFAF